jgi:hypothetical protein
MLSPDGRIGQMMKRLDLDSRRRSWISNSCALPNLAEGEPLMRLGEYIQTAEVAASRFGSHGVS